MRFLLFMTGGLLVGWGCAVSALADDREPLPRRVATFVTQYCLDCHAGDSANGELDLEQVLTHSMLAEAGTWESVTRRLLTRQMPPLDAERPSEEEYARVQTALETALDRQAERHPYAGRTDALRRLNRTQYAYAIRDLFGIEVDVRSWLPPDEVSHGFDNITVSELSPTLLNRYVTAAQKIAKVVVGASARGPQGDTLRLKPDLTQEEHVAGLPIGTRGGTVWRYTFPRDGEYDLEVRLARDRNEEVEGLRREHTLEMLLDRRRVGVFPVRPPRDGNHSRVDSHLRQRVAVKAGTHALGVTFLKQPTALIETKRQPYDAHFNMHRHPRQSPAIFQISITGPYSGGASADSPSRQRLFVCRPTAENEEQDCAERILRNLMRRAYRRRVVADDLRQPMRQYQRARDAGQSFDAGVEAAVSAVLVNPSFLFHLERDPPQAEPGESYRLRDVELASRLAFFLWSSVPDEQLLATALSGELQDPQILAAETRRMLADPRARALSTNFASQWLYLRNLESITPDLRRFPDFDDNLRQAFRQETEWLFDSLRQEDRSVLQLLRSDYTFLNERLAKHYRLPHIQGSRMRRVALPAGSQRGGILRHGSVLTVTSYATRTSPVLRGNWVLENLVGAPPPPPPADVPALQENTVDQTLSVRERLAAHRANPACAGCHRLMDPVGFALANYDAVGRWRDVDQGRAIDATGGLHGAADFVGVAGLERALLERPEVFATALSEKLLTFAVGRGVEPRDGPAIRQIVRSAGEQQYRFSALIVGVVQSVPFQMRAAGKVAPSP
ncbi:MAG: hypothetical protein CL681_00655 [Blastopirellula sp.]|nr:hypothetical protein [Blastopirellula sp.]